MSRKKAEKLEGWEAKIQESGVPGSALSRTALILIMAK